jgi:hypothetical protein
LLPPRRRWWWLYLTLLRGLWLLALLWRWRAWPLRRLFLLFLVGRGGLGDHKYAIEWRGVCRSKHHRRQDRADQESRFCFGHPLPICDVKRLQILNSCRTKMSQLGHSKFNVDFRNGSIAAANVDRRV